MPLLLLESVSRSTAGFSSVAAKVVPLVSVSIQATERCVGAMMFIELRDGTGWPPVLQTVLTGDLVGSPSLFNWFDSQSLHSQKHMTL